MDEEVPKTAAEFMCTREALGLSQDGLAALLGVTQRSITRWESGGYPISDAVTHDMGQLTTEAAELVEATITELTESGATTLTTWRTNPAFWAAHPHYRPRPASWHRAIAARAATALPHLHLTFGDAS